MTLSSRLVRLVVALPAAAALGLGLPTAASAAPAPGPQPLERAHAHNDYEHERPLLDALDHGFTSVEADVYLVDGQLLVGHDPQDLTPERTLQSLYLDPLREVTRRNGGAVHPGWDGSLQLLIDIKNTGPATYTAIDAALRRYPDVMTRWTDGRVTERAVTAVISGDRPRALMESQRTRFAAYDGRLGDLGGAAPATFMPLISDSWTRHFVWQGVGPMPPMEREKLRTIVRQAHDAGRRVRFYATPDVPLPHREALWRELVAAGVDHLNTDDLPALRDFLLAEDPQERRSAA